MSIRTNRRRRPQSTAATIAAIVLAVLGWLLKDFLPQEQTRPAPASSPRSHAASVRTDVAPITGRCTKVFDGDTYEVELPEGRRRIRVKGIDTPESAESDKALRQAEQLGVTLPALLRAGQSIKAEARALVEGREVTVVAPGGLLQPDDYGRLLAYIEVGGNDVGAELIARGLALCPQRAAPRAKRPTTRSMRPRVASTAASINNWSADRAPAGPCSRDVACNVSTDANRIQAAGTGVLRFDERISR
jgi:endonuclease YncB( thermonuclease family)